MNNKKAFVSYLTENLLFRIIICIFIPLLLFAILLISAINLEFFMEIGYNNI